MLIKVRDSRTETVRSKDLMGRWWNPDEDIISNPMDHIEELKCYLSKVFESKTHPLGKVMRILVLTFEASYSPQHPAILHIALRNVSKFKSRVLSSKNLVTINFHRKRVWNTKKWNPFSSKLPSQYSSLSFFRIAKTWWARWFTVWSWTAYSAYALAKNLCKSPR